VSQEYIQVADPLLKMHLKNSLPRMVAVAARRSRRPGCSKTWPPWALAEWSRPESGETAQPAFAALTVFITWRIRRKGFIFDST
jgi:hypothetical protein